MRLSLSLSWAWTSDYFTSVNKYIILYCYSIHVFDSSSNSVWPRIMGVFSELFYSPSLLCSSSSYYYYNYLYSEFFSFATSHYFSFRRISSAYLLRYLIGVIITWIFGSAQSNNSLLIWMVFFGINHKID